eukprot:CAMPEP_0114260484 /NCGR_PEP_ID=MMETSP0058-20121206/20519_1 /TAXON_ID=36894 /ORGANISM="Pyramimonas parkeae, CCMP726" /LENGTH=319 /DNA_ID=CAMNT_0001375737 /DNA_START=156 /DNA_END=1112 /DNA_ORIENTATION=+
MDLTARVRMSMLKLTPSFPSVKMLSAKSAIPKLSSGATAQARRVKQHTLTHGGVSEIAIRSNRFALKHSDPVFRQNESNPSACSVNKQTDFGHRTSWMHSGLVGIVAVWLIAGGSAVASSDVLSGTFRVVDGDTLKMGDERVRLYGVDAPESKQMCTTNQGKEYACGVVSTQQLEQHIGNQKVSCAVKNKDQYGRNVAVCSAGGEDLNRWMVQNGLAVAYREFSSDYVRDEENAKLSRKGIWSGNFQEPAAWRRAQKAVGNTSPASAPEHLKGCDIKGNINSKGDKIYHVPGGQYYDATIIDGQERWFCSEKQAVDAGW